MSFLFKLETALRVGLKWGMIVGFSGSALMYLVQLICRVFFQFSIYQIDWWIQYGFVISALMGAGYAVKENENIKIELFQRLSKKKWIKRINAAISAITTLLIIWVFYLYTIETMGGEIKNLLISIPYIYLFSVSLVSYLIKTTALEEKKLSIETK